TLGRPPRGLDPLHRGARDPRGARRSARRRASALATSARPCARARRRSRRLSAAPEWAALFDWLIASVSPRPIAPTGHRPTAANNAFGRHKPPPPPPGAVPPHPKPARGTARRWRQDLATRGR